MEAVECIVTNAPSQQSVKANIIFVAEPISCTYVSVRSKTTSLVFNQKQCDDVKKLQVGINAVQRRCLQISCGEKVIIEPVVIDDVVRALTIGVKLECNSLETDLYVKESDLSSHIAQTYESQIWTKGQSLAIDVMGRTVILSVLRLYGPSETSVPSQVERAVLTSDTVFNCSTDCDKLKLDVHRNIPIMRHGDIDFASLGIGGLDQELAEIFRRAFASRLIPEAIVRKLGIRHVKGILLHGLPGLGKTLIARRLSGLLTGKKPKLVNGPEILNKYVGASEENIRKLFAEAEEAQRKGDPDLHVIILDEIDAICRTRGASKSDVNVHDTIVNQLLTKMDGVEALDNILLIGMTNRKDILDPALSRPGRFELQIEIGLPTEKGRLQILEIHTLNMNRNSYLHSEAVSYLKSLAVKTVNFTGAELRGLVNSAVSYALERHLASQSDDDENIRIVRSDFDRALTEIKPAFGVSSGALTRYHQWGMICYGSRYDLIVEECNKLTQSLQNACTSFALTTLCLIGTRSTGKTSVAAMMGLTCAYPFVRMISLDEVLGLSDAACVQVFRTAFADATKSTLSMVILDDIGALPRLNRGVLEAITVLLRTPPPDGHKLFVVCTCLEEHSQHYEIPTIFDHVLSIPELTKREAECVLSQKRVSDSMSQEILRDMASTIPIKKLLHTYDVVTSAPGTSEPLKTSYACGTLTT